MTKTTTNEKRSWKVARSAAKAIIRLRKQGLLTAAKRIEEDAIRTCEEIRAGRL